eukprot:Nitzschia sp. Nitz4//scaffold4_size323378//207815//209578//NITZ4_000679-RA/size323378-processed-gene-0.293-mRNA-1//1//CDS//3329553456//7673//frame0
MSTDEATEPALNELEDSTSSDPRFTHNKELRHATSYESEEEPRPQLTANRGRSSDFVFRLKSCIVALSFIVGVVLCFIEMGRDSRINQTLAICIWMAALWLTELIPLVVTAFMPLFLFPAFGILSAAEAATNYSNDIVFLFVSGFMVALTLERWDLHLRFSLKITSYSGGRPSALLFGMMGASFLLSMFVSNTATTLMMVPNAISVIESLERTTLPRYLHEVQLFGTALLLGIAYAANVGGMTTVVGTAPNLVCQAQLAVLFPEAPPITFAEWLGFGFPIGCGAFIVIWLYLRTMYLRNFQGEAASRFFFQREYEALGPWSYEQVTVATSFAVLAVLWLFRGDLIFDSFTIKGWTNLFPKPSYITDSTVGMAVAVFLFLCPARSSRLPGANQDEDTIASSESQSAVTKIRKRYDTTLLNWETANRMPYDIVFLFGGGFTLAKAFVKSGLSDFLGEKLGAMDVSLGAQIFILVFVIVWLTEFTSNTATSNVMIPIAASLAVGARASPYSFMIPAAIACSCAFCLPVATPPNMVAFSSGRLPMVEMNKAGIFLNMMCTFLILGLAFTIIPAVVGVGVRDFPEWAQSAAF